jgi:DNA-binding CsgD family transcriptional regulator
MNTTSIAGLRGRQIETLRLIADGHTTSQIASVLALAIKTVEKHRQSLMDALDIHSIALLTRYAVSTGLVEPNWSPNGRTQHRSRIARHNRTAAYPPAQRPPANGNGRTVVISRRKPAVAAALQLH